MASEDSSKGLPLGWTPHFEVLNSGRRVQCYMNSGTGQKFYSKADLMRYVTTQNPQLAEPEPESPPVESPIEGFSDNNQMHLLEYTSEHPEWLPLGWIMELKTRKSGRCKCYVDPSTGCKFYSKPQVLRHLKTVKQKSSTSKQKEMPKSIVLGSKPEWLPHGWIVETKTIKSGPSRGTTYKVYVDPSSGCKFVGKPEVLRYLDTVKNQNSTSEQKEMPISIVPTINPIQCTDEQPEWLPQGWIVEIKTKKSGSAQGKKYKIFIDPSTGRKFFSKPEVLRYLESVKNKNSTSKQKEMPMSIVPTSNVATGKSTLEDLPPGWIKEIKTRKSCGKKHKVPFYTDPVSGYVFRSKRDVHRYLETGDIAACAIEPKKRNIENKSLVTTSEELPPGWIKKIKVSRTGFTTRKDKFYIDPVSGYEFRSKRDVHRYLETGDIRACTTLPKKRDMGGKSLPSSATKRQKLERPVTSHQLLGENRSSDMGSMGAPLNIRPLAIAVDKSLRRSPRFDDIESKEKSNKKWSPAPKADYSQKNENKNMSVVIKTEERYPTQNSFRKSKNQKWHSLPRRCSNRLAGFEPDMEINSLSIVQLSSEDDKKEGKKSRRGTEAVGSYEMKTRNSLTKSKKALNLPLLRTSVANSVVIVQSLPKTDRSPNGEATLAVDLNKGVVAQAEPIKELVVHTSSDANNLLLGEPSNESQGSEAKCSHPEADMKHENCLERVNKQGSQVKDENNLRASMKKKEFNLPCRSSKRLAPTEPEMKADSASVTDGLANEAQAPKLIQAEHGLETPQLLHGDPLNEDEPFLDARDGAGSEDIVQTMGKKDDKTSESEFQKVEVSKRDEKKSESEEVSKRDEKKSESEEVSKSDGKKSESEFIPPLGEILSDPCLEFAFKTLTGELPVEMASVDGTVSTPASDIPGERNLTPEKMEKRSNKGKVPISSKKSKTTTSSLPHEVLESHPEPEATPIVKGCAFENMAGQSSKTGAAPNNSAVAPDTQQAAAPNNSAVAPDTQQAHHYNANRDKPEQPPVFTFNGYWSHPSLESITGSLPVEASIQGKSYLQKEAKPEPSSGGYVQQQSEISEPAKKVSATVPDYGFPSLFQTDVSVHSGSLEQRISSQPKMPIKDNPFLSSGSLTFSSFSGKGGGFSSCKGIGFQPPPPMKKNQASPLGGGFSSFKGTGFQPPPPPIKKNQPSPPAKKPRGRPRKVTS